LHIAFYHTVSSEASSDRCGSRECFADAVFGAVVAMDELSGVWSRRLSVQPLLWCPVAVFLKQV
ncbi:hypothetical protein Tco_0186486, partial [Tanacetum coccineum]